VANTFIHIKSTLVTDEAPVKLTTVAQPLKATGDSGVVQLEVAAELTVAVHELETVVRVQQG